MRMRQKIMIFALITALLAGLTACGGENPSSAAFTEPESSEIVVAEESEPAPQPSGAEEERVPNSEKVTVRVGTLKGPTGMGMAGLMQQNEAGDTDNIYDFTLADAPDGIRAKLIAGELDVAALPTNMAAVLYNKADKAATLLAVNTLGVLYIVGEDESVTSMEALRGKTLYATGKASVPEYVLNYLLEKNGITPGADVVIEWKTEHAELASLMAAGEVMLGMLPEPHVTTTTVKNDKMKVLLDLTSEWDKAAGGVQLAMGCIVVRNDFLTENREAVEAFLDEYEESVMFANRDIEDAADRMGTYGIIAKEVALKAIPNSNLVYMDGADMKAAVEQFLQVLLDADPQSVGGALPGDDFYYERG